MLKDRKINQSNICAQKQNKTKILTHARAFLRRAPLSSAKKFLAKRGPTSTVVLPHIVIKNSARLNSEVGPHPKTPSFFACGVSKFLFLFCFCSFCFVPFVLFAQIEITEIMYNPGEDTNGSKADGGREWIEIYNSDLEGVDLTGWKLVDNKGGHPFSIIQGSFIIGSQEYLIIADFDSEKDDSTFLTDYSNFSGTVLNSNFGSLTNKEEGGTLLLKNSDLEDIVQVSYLPVSEADDTGNSLQKINGEWVAGIPSPGASNSQPSASDNSPTEESSETTPPDRAPAIISQPTIEPQISAQIIPPIDIPVAGADFLFEAKAFGLQNKPLQKAEYQWTFGDGAKAVGQNVLYAYQYPSDYMVVLQIISGKYTDTDRFKIKVIPSDIIISEIGLDVADNFIELHNPSSYELNLSWWRLKVDNNYFTIPQNTILLPKNRVKFSARTTNLFPRENSQIDLLYPNGMLAFEYAKIKKIGLDIPEKAAKFVVKTAFTQNPPQFGVNTVQKQPIVGQIETSVQQNSDQMATIAGAALTPNLISLGPTSSNPIAKQTAKKSPFNKWTFSLLGITIMAIVGVAFASKLDKNDSNT